MNIDDITLSHKYATAFLNLFIDEIKRTNLKSIEELIMFLESSPEITALFKLPRIANVAKREVSQRIINNYKLPSHFHKLIDLLMSRQRLFLLLPVLKKIHQLYYEQKKIMEFEIESTAKLTSDQLDTIVNFLRQRTGNEILYTYKENSALIAGIRIHSTYLSWENTVANQLRKIQQSLTI